MKGWIKLHRKTLDNDIFRNDPTAWRLFEYLLLTANPKGEVINTLRNIGATLDMAASTVLRAGNRLEVAQMTQQTTQHRKTKFVICNWSIYQANGQQHTQHRRNTGATPTQHPPLAVRNKNKEIRITSSSNKEYKQFLKQKEALKRAKQLGRNASS